MPMHQLFHISAAGDQNALQAHLPNRALLIWFVMLQDIATPCTRSAFAPRCFCLQWRTSVLQTSCIWLSITRETSLPPPQLGCPQGHGTPRACTLHCPGHLSICQITLLPRATTGTAGHSSTAWLAPNLVMQTQGIVNKPDLMLKQSD